MIALDCESRHSALESLSAIFGVSPAILDGFLTEFDLDEHFETHDPLNYGNRELRLVLEHRLNVVAAPLDRVYWFHLSRTLPDTDFADGIQPLAKALDPVWRTLLHVFSGTPHEERLIQMKEAGVPSFQYRLKVGSPKLAGPYAMLVRESAFRSREMGNHDYLRLPEIVEDICIAYTALFGEEIQPDLNNALVPTIVKFWSSETLGIDCVEAALHYLYATGRGLPMDLNSNTCFDGRNEVVPPERIASVERSPG